jgi:hypothetical protein
MTNTDQEAREIQYINLKLAARGQSIYRGFPVICWKWRGRSCKTIRKKAGFWPDTFVPPIGGSKTFSMPIS